MVHSDDERTIFCSNLADNVTEALLYELFYQVGPLDRVHIPSKNNRQCSYGFVTYTHYASVPYAVELYSGTRLFDREIGLRARTQDKAESVSSFGQAQHQSSRGSDNKRWSDGHQQNHHQQQHQSNAYSGDPSNHMRDYDSGRRLSYPHEYNVNPAQRNMSPHAPHRRSDQHRTNPFGSGGGGGSDHRRNWDRNHGSNSHTDRSSRRRY